MINYSLEDLNYKHCLALDKFQKKNYKHLKQNIWSKKELEELLKKNLFGTICKENKEIIAFFLAHKCHDFLEILSIFVSPSYRRMGIAETILDNCIFFCKKEKIKKIFLEVSVNNTFAKELYLKKNFVIHTIRKGYYFEKNTKIDGLLMQLSL